ncbi:MAG: hypothetical protein QXO30_00845 [Candidatus Caldarchaeum sp.]
MGRRLGKCCEVFFRLFVEMDCELAEINPLTPTSDGKLRAIDSKVILDENALYRHREFAGPSAGSGLEEETRKLGLTAVSIRPFSGSMTCTTSFLSYLIWGGEPR